MRVERTGKFKRDYKREKKGRHRVSLDAELMAIVLAISNQQPLAEKYRDHALSGEWKDHRDCHVKPDLILIYRNRPVTTS